MDGDAHQVGYLLARGGANGLDPASAPGLVFVTLPVAFAAMPGGRVAAVVFFALLVIAALGSAIAMLEGAVAVADHRLGWSRRRR